MLSSSSEFERTMATIAQVNLRAVASEAASALFDLVPNTLEHVQQMVRVAVALSERYPGEFGQTFIEALSRKISSTLDYGDLHRMGSREATTNRVGDPEQGAAAAQTQETQMKRRNEALHARRMTLLFILLAARAGLIEDVNLLVTYAQKTTDEILMKVRKTPIGIPRKPRDQTTLPSTFAGIEIAIDTIVAIVSAGHADLFLRLSQPEMAYGNTLPEGVEASPISSTHLGQLMEPKGDLLRMVLALENENGSFTLKGIDLVRQCSYVTAEMRRQLYESVGKLYTELEARARTLYSLLRKVYASEYQRKLSGKGFDQSKQEAQLKGDLAALVQTLSAISTGLALKPTSVPSNLTPEEVRTIHLEVESQLADVVLEDATIAHFREAMFTDEETRRFYQELPDIAPYIMGEFARLITPEALVTVADSQLPPRTEHNGHKKEKKQGKDKKDKAEKSDKSSKAEEVSKADKSDKNRKKDKREKELRTSVQDEPENESTYVLNTPSAVKPGSDESEIELEIDTTSMTDIGAVAEFDYDEDEELLDDETELQPQQESLIHSIEEQVLQQAVEATLPSSQPSEQDDLTDHQVEQLLAELPLVRTKESADNLAIRITKALSTNLVTRQNLLLRALFTIELDNLDKLPLYARITATLSRYLPRLADSLAKALELELKTFFTDARFVKHLELKQKNMRFIAELTKFKLMRPFELWRSLLVLVARKGASLPGLTASGRPIAMHAASSIATLLKFCGTWLCGDDDTRIPTLHLLRQMESMTKDDTLAPMIVTTLSTGLTYCNPPILSQAVPTISLMEAYIQHIFKSRPQEAVEALLTLDWSTGLNDFKRLSSTAPAIAARVNLSQLLVQLHSAQVREQDRAIRTEDGHAVLLSPVETTPPCSVVLSVLLCPERLTTDKVRDLAIIARDLSMKLRTVRNPKVINRCQRFGEWLIDSLVEKFTQQLERNEVTERQDRLVFGRYLITLEDVGLVPARLIFRLLYELLCRLRNDPQVDPVYDTFRIRLIHTMLTTMLNQQRANPSHHILAKHASEMKKFMTHFALYVHTKGVLPLDLSQDIRSLVQTMPPNCAVDDPASWTSLHAARYGVYKLMPQLGSSEGDEPWKSIPDAEKALFGECHLLDQEDPMENSQLPLVAPYGGLRRTEALVFPTYIDYVQYIKQKNAAGRASELSSRKVSELIPDSQKVSQRVLVRTLDAVLKECEEQESQKVHLEQAKEVGLIDATEMNRLVEGIHGRAHHQKPLQEADHRKTSAELAFEAEFQELINEGLQRGEATRNDGALRAVNEFIHSRSTRKESEALAADLRSSSSTQFVPFKLVTRQLVTRGDKGVKQVMVPGASQIVKSFVRVEEQRRIEAQEHKQITIGLIRRQQIEEYLIENGHDPSDSEAFERAYRTYRDQGILLPPMKWSKAVSQQDPQSTTTASDKDRQSNSGKPVFMRRSDFKTDDIGLLKSWFSSR